MVRVHTLTLRLTCVKVEIYSTVWDILWRHPGTYLSPSYYVYPNWEAMLEDKIAWEGCLRSRLQVLLLRECR